MDALDQCSSSELVAGEYDLERASLYEVLGGQEMREAERVLGRSASILSEQMLGAVTSFTWAGVHT